MVADDASAPDAPKHQPHENRISTACQRETRRRVRVIPPETFNPVTAEGLCSVTDAAAVLIQAAGSMARGKLQDLLYFAQAWHLVWDNELLYPDPIIATDDSVRIEAIEKRIGKDFTVTEKHFRPGRADRLTDSQKRTLVGMINFYGSLNHYRLSGQIREAPPWQQARAGTVKDGHPVIEPLALFRHYRTA